jgi:hypothetical protein
MALCLCPLFIDKYHSRTFPGTSETYRPPAGDFYTTQSYQVMYKWNSSGILTLNSSLIHRCSKCCGHSITPQLLELEHVPFQINDKSPWVQGSVSRSLDRRITCQNALQTQSCFSKEKAPLGFQGLLKASQTSPASGRRQEGIVAYRHHTSTHAVSFTKILPWIFEWATSH